MKFSISVRGVHIAHDLLHSIDARIGKQDKTLQITFGNIQFGSRRIKEGLQISRSQKVRLLVDGQP